VISMIYEKKHGSYYLRADRYSAVILLMTDQVAFSYSKQDSGESVMLKHGAPDTVNAWAANARKKYIESGWPEMAQSIEVVILPATFEVEEINRCLDTTCYLGRLLKLIEEGRIDENGKVVAAS
jgi:hypothetical protein